MKKTSLILLTAAFLIGACNNSDDTSDATTDPGTPGVENVNGNIPDTTNSINLNSQLRTDSSSTDTTVHH